MKLTSLQFHTLILMHSNLFNNLMILGSIPASSNTVESEGRQMKQGWIAYIKKEKKSDPGLLIGAKLHRRLFCSFSVCVLALLLKMQIWPSENFLKKTIIYFNLINIQINWLQNIMRFNVDFWLVASFCTIICLKNEINKMLNLTFNNIFNA